MINTNCVDNDDQSINERDQFNSNGTSSKRKYAPPPITDFHAAGAENALWEFTDSDFLNSNCSFDDPIENFENGELQGSDGLPLRRVIVDDVVKERRIVDSVIKDVTCIKDCARPITDHVVESDLNVSDVCRAPLTCLSVPHASIGSPNMVNDSGTEYSVLTLETAKDWNGKALKELLFQGVAGNPFSVFGGDDLIGEIKNSCGKYVHNSVRFMSNFE